jgi:glycosyltransferase involved in cell wall biosynthesis
MGGVEKLILTLSEQLHNLGYAHFVLCFRDTFGLAAQAHWPLTIRELHPARNLVAESWSLARHLRTMKGGILGKILAFDMKSAVYCSLFPIPPYILHVDDPPSLLARDISKQAWSARNRWPAFRHLAQSGFLRTARAESVYRLIWRGMKKARRVVVTTKRSGKELESLYRINTELIRLGIKPAEARMTTNAESCLGTSQPLRFLSVSRLESNKRVDWILKAMTLWESAASSNGNVADWELDIVGEGSQRESLETMSRKLVLDRKVKFHGFVSEERLMALYKSATVFIMPAVQGYGIPALEALAQHIPVVLHEDSGVSEILVGNCWTEVVRGEAEGLALGISHMVNRLRDGKLPHSSLPFVPTEKEWVQNISNLCEWADFDQMTG